MNDTASTGRSSERKCFSDLINTIKKTRDDVDVKRVEKAYEFAKKAHEGQFRMSGSPYVCHPVETAKILVDLHAHEDVIIAGLLHDVPEDTEYSVTDIEKKFGKHVAEIVDALTKLSKVHYKHSMGDRQVQALRKMFIETAKDMHVVIVKLADRLHNMTTLQYLRPDKQQRIAKETMEIYAPLANLYGIYQLRQQLEDLCFMYLQPEEYARIESFVHDNEKKRKHFINDTVEVFKKALKKEDVKVEIQGRPKHFYSIYQKMIRDKKVLQDIFDYSAVRIIVKDKTTCYKALGVVHEVFRPKPKRVKDYIALPKANGYRSLHTTVIGLRGKLTEVQIRTENMHIEAEYGAAAHSIYKDEGLDYLSESISKLQKYKNPESFIQGLYDDVLQERIFVFSPKGKIINLPSGATCLDYVYAVDIPTNKKTFRAVVNNKSYSLTGELQSGDHVEIIYGNKDQEGPDRWWMEHVKTSKAKEKIQEYFKQKSFQERVEIGEKLLQQEMDHEYQGLIYQLPKAQLQATAERFAMKTFEELLAQVGEGALSSNEVYQSMFPDLDIHILTRGWRILRGFLQKFNLWQLDEDNEKFRMRIMVEAHDKVGILSELLMPFYELKIPIIKNWGGAYTAKKVAGFNYRGPAGAAENTRISRDFIVVEIDDHEDLIALFDRLEKIPGVIRVQRVFRRRQISFGILLTVTLAYIVGHPFLLKFLLIHEPEWGRTLLNSMIYAGLLGIFILMAWLRTMGSRTFPHFEETRAFWPLSFGVSILAIITVFVDDAVFDLELHMPIMIGISLLILIYLYASFRSHERRRASHLNRLKSARMKVGKTQKK